MSTPDPRALRDAFGAFITGVTVVTTLDGGGTPVGFTANSFTSVSLDPPLLLVCPGRALSSFPVFQDCRHFAVSVLAGVHIVVPVGELPERIPARQVSGHSLQDLAGRRLHQDGVGLASRLQGLRPSGKPTRPSTI